VAGFRGLAAVFRRSSRPGTFSADDLARYAEAAAQPGALTGMLAWYRAGLRRRLGRPPTSRVEAPTLILWGLDDVALGPELVAPSAARCRAAEVVTIAGAGHWVQHEAAAEVNERLLAFLARPAQGAPPRSS
jgi:pimeloyl-ACP methyl ester carboxylesterase